MSIQHAEVWANSTFRHQGALQDALQTIRQAGVEHTDASFVVAPELTKRRRCYVARLTNGEVVMLELSPAQQRRYGLRATQMIAKTDPPSPHLALPPVMLATLSNVRFDNASAQDAKMPVSGTASFCWDDASHGARPAFALRAEYIHHDLHRTETHFCYPVATTGSSCEDVRFSFSPLVTTTNPSGLHGTLVVFLAVFTAQNWTTHQGFQRISNIVAAAVDLQ